MINIIAAKDEVWKLIPTNGMSIHLLAAEPPIVVPWLSVYINNNNPTGKRIIDIPLKSLWGTNLMDIISKRPNNITIKCLIK